MELICSATELGDTVGKIKQGRGSLSGEIGLAEPRYSEGKHDILQSQNF